MSTRHASHEKFLAQLDPPPGHIEATAVDKMLYVRKQVKRLDVESDLCVCVSVD